MSASTRAGTTVCHLTGRRITAPITAVSAAPVKATENDTRGAPPIEASDSIGPPTWPKAVRPQGNPPNGNDERAHSTVTHMIANHNGAAGQVVVRQAITPNNPV